MVTKHDRSDAALDRLITEALDVEVAPEFVARVREHVATARVRAASLAWWGVAAAAAVSAIALAWLTYPMEPSTVAGTVASVAVSPVSPAPAAEASPVVSPDPRVSNSVTHEQPISPARVTRTEQPPDSAPIEPDVIVDVREARAIQALVTRIRNGRLDASQLPEPPAPTETLQTTEIAISPITVPLLTFAADIHKAAEGLE